MGYNNPPIKWSELERKLSDRSRPGSHGERPVTADGGDSPAWSQHREPCAARACPPARECSALRGAARALEFLLPGRCVPAPEDLVEAAVRQGLHALALTDHDGFYGAARFAEAAAAYGLPRSSGRSSPSA